MTSLQSILDGVGAAMENAVPEMTTALTREADATDNAVKWPHGEILIVSSVRSDAHNTDLVGYTTDGSGNRTGRIYEALFDVELQLNVWISVPSDTWNIKELGRQLREGLYQYDHNRRDTSELPDGDGGTLTDVSRFTVDSGGELPVDSQNPPIRGYQQTVSLRFSDRTTTDAEYVTAVNTPSDGGLVDGDDVAIEYNT